MHYRVATNANLESPRARSKISWRIAVLCAAELALVLPSAHAADANSKFSGKYYIGLGAGYYTAKIGADSDARAVFGRYFGGRRLGERWSIELGLNRYKDISSKAVSNGEQQSVAHAWVGDVTIGPSYPLANRLDVYARLGWSLQHSSLSNGSSEDASNQGLVSFGFTFGFYDDAPIRLEYSRLEGNHVVRNVNQFSIQILSLF